MNFIQSRARGRKGQQPETDAGRVQIPPGLIGEAKPKNRHCEKGAAVTPAIKRVDGQQVFLVFKVKIRAMPERRKKTWQKLWKEKWM